MQLTIKYLQVGNAADAWPVNDDQVPEVDAELTSPTELVSIIQQTTSCTVVRELYVQLPRPDGTLRWQDIKNVSELPQDLLRVKIIGSSVQLVKPAPFRKEGISGRWFVIDREPKVDEVLDLASTTAVVKVESPPATGKTSFMQKLCDRARQKGWGRVLECSAADCKGEVTINSVLKTSPAAKGLDWVAIHGETTPVSSAGGAPPGGEGVNDAYTELGTLTLICIDEAQLMFSSSKSDTEALFWANVKRLQQTGGCRRSVRIVLFVLYGDGPSGLPRVGHVSTPIELENVVKFRRSPAESSNMVELALDESEYKDLWGRFISGANFNHFFQDMDLQQELLQMTSGHVGIITTVMDKLHSKLVRRRRDLPSNVGVGDKLIRYMLRTRQMGDCVKSVRGVLGDLRELGKLQPILSAVWTAGPDGCYEEEIINAYVQHRASCSSSSRHDQEVLEQEAAELLRQQYYAGYLLQDAGNKRYYYPTPLHYSYYLMQLRRASFESLVITSDEDFRAFLRHTISRMSGSALQRSYSRRALNSRRVYERHYQVEWYRAAAALVPGFINISPDVGKVFSCQGFVDFWIQPGTPHNDDEPEDYQLPQGWAVELLVHGDRAQKHVGRFGPGAVYAPLPCAQHAVIDFWAEEPKADSIRLVTEAEAYYVVHFQADFKSAKFLAPGGKEETLMLS